ncbi:MAG: hypothetical protein ACRC47_00665 [Shewanella sp.]
MIKNIAMSTIFSFFIAHLVCFSWAIIHGVNPFTDDIKPVLFLSCSIGFVFSSFAAAAIYHSEILGESK